MNIIHRVIDDGTQSVKSLVWEGDDLVDWCQGGVRWDAAGKRHESRVMTAFEFDAAIASPCGEYYCIFTRTGTKAVIGSTNTRKHLRELNRSYYFANVYEMPVVFATMNSGRTAIIHCPDKYNRLEIEDVETGERLGYQHPALGETARHDVCSPDTMFDNVADGDDESVGDDPQFTSTRKPSDVFHSRLSVSRSGRWLVSNGWYWHPHDTVEVFPLQSCGADARLLDKRQFVPPGCPIAQSACFLDDARLLIGLGEGWYNEQGDEVRGQTTSESLNTLAIWRIGDESYQQVTHQERQTGMLLPLEDDMVLDLYEFPKIINLRDGGIVEQWPEILSGQQASSIVRDRQPLPIAFDPVNFRIGVHSEEKIHILQIEKRS